MTANLDALIDKDFTQQSEILLVRPLLAANLREVPLP